MQGGGDGRDSLCRRYLRYRPGTVDLERRHKLKMADVGDVPRQRCDEQRAGARWDCRYRGWSGWPVAGPPREQFDDAGSDLRRQRRRQARRRESAGRRASAHPGSSANASARPSPRTAPIRPLRPTPLGTTRLADAVGQSLRGSITTSTPRAKTRAASTSAVVGVRERPAGNVPVHTEQLPHGSPAWGSSSDNRRNDIRQPAPAA